MRNRTVFGLTLTIGIPALRSDKRTWQASGQAKCREGGDRARHARADGHGNGCRRKVDQGQGKPVDIHNAKLEGNKLTFSARRWRWWRGGGVAVVVPPPVGRFRRRCSSWCSSCLVLLLLADRPRCWWRWCHGRGGGGGGGGALFNYTATLPALK